MPADEASNVRIRVLLLRHGQVAHHRGDVPLTDLGNAQSEAAGRWFASESMPVACVLTGETERARQTGARFVAAYTAGGEQVASPTVSFALRNPDLYLGGTRINMAEGAEALAAQAPGVTPEDVLDVPFYQSLMTAKDRVGYWLEHKSPPGDNATAVGRRINNFARSLADRADLQGRTVVAMTHSPVLRAVRYHHWAEYSREPPFLHGYSLTLYRTNELKLEIFTTDTGDIPATARPGPGVVRPDKEDTA